MKLNHVMVVYWIILLLFGCSGFYYVEGSFIEIIGTGLYVLLLFVTTSLLFTIAMDRVTNYQRSVVILAICSSSLHAFTYLHAIVSSNRVAHFLPTIVVLVINTALLMYMYSSARGGK